MDPYAWAERSMAMDDATWLRHANPWSVWTRFTGLPLLTLAAFSCQWIGAYAVLPIGLAPVWAWWTPRAFPVPRSTDNWASKGTFGERVFLERRRIDVPEHHVRAANVLALLAAAGLPIWLYGLLTLDAWAAVAGVLATALPRAWFVDRMVWIYEEMKDRDPRYGAWLRGEGG